MRLPRVDRILDQPALAASPVLREIKRRWVGEALERCRAAAARGELHEPPSEAEVAAEVAARLDASLEPRPRPLINATGVLLHTNLGRAPLSPAARAAVAGACGTCDLEYVPETGARGSRLAALAPLLAALVGAEAVHVVGNGAAALLLACTALGVPGGVVLSRGQMVEIGDGFRVAEMAAAGGVRLWEVGSTNRTHLADYLAALQAGAAAILWVHLSNFQQVGFVHAPALRELAGAARERGVPLIADLGSGSLTPGREPTVQEYLDAGADLVTFSGDKLLGGPQAGLLAGSAELVARCRRHPLARALRPGKLTLAALHATAVEYATGRADELPLRRMITCSIDQLRARAAAIVRALGWPEASICASEATVGGGSLPGETLPSLAHRVPAADLAIAARRLRLAGVVGRVHEGQLLLDLRSAPPESDPRLLEVLRGLADG